MTGLIHGGDSEQIAALTVLLVQFGLFSFAFWKRLTHCFAEAFIVFLYFEINFFVSLPDLKLNYQPGTYASSQICSGIGWLDCG